LKENNVTFENIDVGSDQKYDDEIFRKAGQMDVPVIDIDGKTIMGFKRDILEKELDIKKQLLNKII
jgi:glutaredoxin 3